MNIFRKPVFIWLILIALLAILFGVWTHHNMQKKSQAAAVALSSGTVLSPARNLNSFTLVDQQHKPFTNNNLKNHWTFVFFGFTHCPMICPTTLSTLNQMYKKLVIDKELALPQVLFISVDPERDTPKKIARYLQSFNSAFLGATGTKQQLEKLTQQFNVMYAKVFPDGDAHYSIDHSGTILLINPQGQLYGIFSTPHDANKLAGDYEIIVNNYK